MQISAASFVQAAIRRETKSSTLRMLARSLSLPPLSFSLSKGLFQSRKCLSSLYYFIRKGEKNKFRFFLFWFLHKQNKFWNSLAETETFFLIDNWHCEKDGMFQTNFVFRYRKKFLKYFNTQRLHAFIISDFYITKNYASHPNYDKIIQNVTSHLVYDYRWFAVSFFCDDCINNVQGVKCSHVFFVHTRIFVI